MKSGDIVSIFSEADIHVPLAEQTKLVTLDGEFVHAGVYSVRPGETLKQLVERAGGVTTKAYLFGSEFTRESVRVEQQARIDEYVRTLQMRIQRSNLALAASSTSTPQDLARYCSKQRTGFDRLPAPDPRHRSHRFDPQAGQRWHGKPSRHDDGERRSIRDSTRSRNRERDWRRV